MSKILVMRYDEGVVVLDDLTEEKKKEINEKLEAFLKDYPNVQFNGTFVNEDGIGIDEWDAPDVDIVEKAVEAIGLPHDEIIEVEKVMP